MSGVLRRGFALPAFAVLAFGLAVALFRGGLFGGPHMAIGWIGVDPAIFMWDMRWAPFAVSHLQSPFATDWVNYPHGVNLLWNTSMVAPALLLSPVTVWGGVLAGFNALMLLAPTASAVAAFAAYRAITGSVAGAAVAGLAYGFCPYVMAQALGHPNLAVAVFPPVALYLLHLLLARDERPWLVGGGLGLAAAVQFLTNEEVLVSTAIVAVIGIVALALLWPRRVIGKAPALLVAAGVAAVTFVVLAGYPAYVQFFGPMRLGRNFIEPDTYVIDLLNFVVPTWVQWLSPGAAVATTGQFTGNIAEWDGYLGIPLLVVIALTLFARSRDRRAWWAFIVFLSAAVLSLGSRAHLHGARTVAVPLPWAAISRVPLLDHLLPARFALHTFLLAGVLLALFVGWLTAQRRRPLAIAGALLVTAVVATLLPEPTYPATRYPEPAFFTDASLLAAVPERSVALVLPMNDEGQTRAMLWHAESGIRFKMPEGRFLVPDGIGGVIVGPRSSATYDTLKLLQSGWWITVPVTDDLVARMRADLRAWRVRTVILGPTTNQERIKALFQAVMDHDPVSKGGVYLWSVTPDTPLPAPTASRGATPAAPPADARSAETAPGTGARAA